MFEKVKKVNGNSFFFSFFSDAVLFVVFDERDLKIYDSDIDKELRKEKVIFCVQY